MNIKAILKHSILPALLNLYLTLKKNRSIDFCLPLGPEDRAGAVNVFTFLDLKQMIAFMDGYDLNGLRWRCPFVNKTYGNR